MSCNIIHEKCEKKAAEDKTLPRNAYLVTYVEKEKLTYDVVMADGKTDIFDQYYDKYKEGLQNIGWTMGTMNARTWTGLNTKPEKKVKRKRK